MKTIEYKLDYLDGGQAELLYNEKLTFLLKFVRNNRIRKYRISILKEDEWVILMDFI